MAFPTRVLLILLVIFTVFQLKIDAKESQIHRKRGLMNCRFDKIYQLGDSVSDTGNCIRENYCGSHSSCAKSPYGINFFHKPTGRCSNGLLMIDFIDCPVQLKKSLFLVGHIGGNDIIYGLSQGKTMEELRRLVTDIVQTIIHGVKRIIGFGATRIIVPGTFPKGCGPASLTQFMTNDSSAYDEYHCLKDLNNLAIFYNDHLQQAIDEMKKEYTNITLVYGDYYNAYMWFLQNAVTLGFDKNSLQKACCGIGGDYNYDKSRKCGAQGVPVCDDPSTHFNWDGLHLTQAAYSWLTRWLIDDMLPKLNCHV
ncbi:acetylajmalan esterase-like isoform X2 [Solanum tuberosum]|uniref:acetylajmalan esterase-like isoform X2 n=1 Tax=Solanum tuberosum TaxID=4113 RepID=UPI00073A10F6|nr:PREDICTED: acetylajmalan esterase-like isoform X2 [Solanum tuberosum]